VEASNEMQENENEERPKSERANGQKEEGRANASSNEQESQKPELEFKTALYIRELEKKVSDYESKINDVREYVKKMEIEIEQIRQRNQRDLQKNLDQSTSRFFNEILPVVDDLERSLKNVKESNGFVDGVRMITEQLHELLRKSGLLKLPALDIPFNPAIHEALTTVEVNDDSKDGIVIDEIKSGYKYKDTIVRPAQVIVGRKAESGEHAEGNQT
jgi:molecular chaperone GrpE